MAQYSDPLDDLPLLNRSRARTQQERVPQTRTFKGALLKTVNRLGLTGKGRGAASKIAWHRARGASAVSVKQPGLQSRRVVMKARVVQSHDPAKFFKSVQLHLRYVERDGVNRTGGKGHFYTAVEREADPKEFLNRAAEDPHQFRFIVSPEDAADLNLTDFTQSLMQTLEADVGRQVDWLAVNHYNTDNPHTHVLIRGRDAAGQELRFDRDYLARGFRDRAQTLATQELGPRNEVEIARSLQNQVEQERWTSLDAQILKVSHEKLLAMDGSRSIGLGEPGSTINPQVDQYVTGRLNHLVTLGLAERDSPRAFTLSSDYQQSLRDLGERHDIIKTLHGSLKGHTGKYRVFDAQQDTMTVEGTLRFKGIHDELPYSHTAIVDSVDGHAYFVKLPRHVDREALQVDSIVRISAQQDPWIKPADKIIAQFAAEHNGLFNATVHANELARQGRYTNSNLDPVDFAQAHERRAQRLVRFGLLQEVDTGFVVPPDLETRLQALDQTRPNPRSVRLTVLETRQLDDQIIARTSTWLDSVKPDSSARWGFGAEVRQAHQDRVLFLESELGLDPASPSLTKTLDSLERQALAIAHTKATNKPELPLTPGATWKGTFVSKLSAPSGKQYGVIESEKAFSLVPWRDRFEQSQGRGVRVGMTQDNTPFVKPLGQGLSK